MNLRSKLQPSALRSDAFQTLLHSVLQIMIQILFAFKTGMLSLHLKIYTCCLLGQECSFKLIFRLKEAVLDTLSSENN